MKQIIISSILISILSCSKNETKNNDDIQIIEFENLEEKKSDTIQEPNYIAIFEEETKSKSELSKKELKIINENLVDAVNKYNEDDKKNRNEKISLRYYYRQYIISKNENGDKIVRVFCFCSISGEFWRNEIISVHDGGNCYLNAVINLTQNKTEYFETNGQA